MPVLQQEVDLHPADLLDHQPPADDSPDGWWAFYTRSRREKEMMRKLLALDVPFYGPVVPQRHRSPSGRLRTAYLPLFPNYVFVYGDGSTRYTVLTTNCVSRSIRVEDGVRLWNDLRQIRRLIENGAPLTVERRLAAGTRVRVRSGPLRGLEGVVVSRQGKTRLVVSVDFLQQGASLVLDDYELEPMD